jgi:CRP-like cAMP-binding protein
MLRKAQASFSRNRLLSTMSADDFERLRPNLQRVQLELKFVMEEPNQAIAYVYFLEPGVASVVAITAGGERMEVGLFGPEGMSGRAVVHGADRSPLQTFVQVPGSALRISADAFRSALDASPTLRRLLLRYMHAFSIQVSFTALANGRYTVDERLSRWLLMCHDRVDDNSFVITHEFLSLMLGVRRAGVTTALHILEGARIIKATRGRVEILDREQLQEAAGDSYGLPEAEYERLIGDMGAGL